MNFSPARRRAPHPSDEPEINLIPLIDVLLVILIFLAATTTFLRQTALPVVLPEASARATAPMQLELSISRDGRYALNGETVGPALPALTRALQQAMRVRAEAEANSSADAVSLLIRADAQSAHQHVVDAMQAAQQAGIARLHFATRSAPRRIP